MRKWLGNLCHMVTAPPKLDTFAVNTRTRSFMGPWVPHFNPDVFWVFLCLAQGLDSFWKSAPPKATESHRRMVVDDKWSMNLREWSLPPPGQQESRRLFFVPGGRVVPQRKKRGSNPRRTPCGYPKMVGTVEKWLAAGW